MFNKRVVAISFICSIVVVSAFGMLKVLQTKKAELTKNRNLIANVGPQLGAAYNQLNNELIGGINNLINGQLNGFIGSVQGARNGINAVPDFVLATAGIGDLKAALESIQDVLQSTKNLLGDIRGSFENVIVDMNSATDPKGIYRGLNAAVVDMDASLKAMEDMEKFLKEVEV